MCWLALLRLAVVLWFISFISFMFTRSLRVLSAVLACYLRFVLPGSCSLFVAVSYCDQCIVFLWFVEFCCTVLYVPCGGPLTVSLFCCG